MVDPVTTLGAGLTVLASKDLLTKLLGPSADYLGGEMKTFVEKSHVNLESIFRAAIEKLGPLANEPGEVSARILKHVIDEGRFCEDPFVVEYLGGILASSRGEASRDDRGTFYLNEITSLSSYQIRTHYLVYASIVRAGNPTKQDTSYWFEENSLSVVIPEAGYVDAMEYTAEEKSDQISYHSFLGLGMRGLCERGTKVKTPPSSHPDFDQPYRFVWPTRYGYELFLWGLGLGKVRATSYFDLEPNHILPVEPKFEPLAIELGRQYF